MYYGEFNSKSDVCREFSISDFDGTVVFAVYNQEDYEGSAEVVFISDGKIFMVQGGHCSCYGLEGQWEPVEMSIGGLRRIVNEGTGQLSQYSGYLNEVMEQIETLNLYEASPDVVYIALKLAFG